MSRIHIPDGNEEFKSKEQLYALFYELTSEVKGREIELDEEQYINNIKGIQLPQLIDYLRDTIQILIKQQVDLAKNYMIKSQGPVYENEREQYEQMIQNYEANERNHIKRYFEHKTLKEILENRLVEFIEMEKEFETLKEKVKYEEGRFLKNERKDNEIIILRAENTILKKAITELEQKSNQSDKEINGRDLLIEQLKDTIEEQKTELERNRKDLKLFSNININISNSGNNNAVVSNGINHGKCSVCGCNCIRSLDKATFEQTQFKMFNIKKAKPQKQKSKIQYNLNQMNGSMSNTHITFDILSSKGSSTSKNINQQNNSMNMMLEKTKRDASNKNIVSNRILSNSKNINPYCMKITKLPVNQSRCPMFNNNSLTTKRDQSNKIVLSKKPSTLINSKSHLNSTISKGEV